MVYINNFSFSQQYVFPFPNNIFFFRFPNNIIFRFPNNIFFSFSQQYYFSFSKQYFRGISVIYKWQVHWCARLRRERPSVLEQYRISLWRTSNSSVYISCLWRPCTVEDRYLNDKYSIGRVCEDRCSKGQVYGVRHIHAAQQVVVCPAVDAFSSINSTDVNLKGKLSMLFYEDNC